MNDKVKTYFSGLRFRFNLLEKYRLESDLLLSKRFSVFDYIYVDENRLSEIIADLLNPKGKHGQGDKFLNEFLKLINKTEFIKNSIPEIKREVSTNYISRNQRRMDILIDWTTSGIVIENKPWAEDQFNQIWDYKENLVKRYNEKFILVYLSKGKQHPSEESIKKVDLKKLIEKQQFIQVSYEKDILNWLKNCAREAQSEKIRHFLIDFINFINKNFNIK